MTLPRKIHLPALPSIPKDTKLDKTTVRILEAMKEAFQVGEGYNTEHLLEKKITRRDLEALGLDTGVIDNPDLTYNFGDQRQGPELTPDEDGPVAAPPPVTALAITQKVFSNFMTWANPTPTPPEDHAATKVFSWPSNDWATASAGDAGLVASVSPYQTYWNDELMADIEPMKYYWVQAVDSTGAADAAEPPQVSMDRDMDFTFGDLLTYLLGSGGDGDFSVPRVLNAMADAHTFYQYPAASAGHDVDPWSNSVGYIDGAHVTYPPGSTAIGGPDEMSNVYRAMENVPAGSGTPDVNASWQRQTFSQAVSALALKQSLKLGYGEDDLPTATINGDLVVTNGVVAKKIHVEENLQVNEGGKFVVGDHNIVMDSVSNVVRISGEGGVSGNDYSEMSDVGAKLYQWVSPGHYLLQDMRHVEAGSGVFGTLVTVPGKWRSAPTVTITPEEYPSFDKDWVSQDQKLRVYTDDVTLTDGVCTFTPNAGVFADVQQDIVSPGNSHITPVNWTTTQGVLQWNASTLSPIINPPALADNLLFTFEMTNPFYTSIKRTIATSGYTNITVYHDFLLLVNGVTRGVSPTVSRFITGIGRGGEYYQIDWGAISHSFSVTRNFSTTDEIRLMVRLWHDSTVDWDTTVSHSALSIADPVWGLTGRDVYWANQTLTFSSAASSQSLTGGLARYTVIGN